jgi:hypothetical protein
LKRLVACLCDEKKEIAQNKINKISKIKTGKNYVLVPVGEMCIKFNATQQGGEARRHGK